MRMRFLLPLFLFSFCSYAQGNKRDSLLGVLEKTDNKTEKVDLLLKLCDDYFNAKPDSILFFAGRALEIAQTNGYEAGEIRSKEKLADYWWAVGDYATALKLNHQVVDYYKRIDSVGDLMRMYGTLLNSYRDQRDYPEALHYGFLMLKEQSKGSEFVQGIINAMIGSVYYDMNNLDSAHFYMEESLRYPHEFNRGWIFLMNARVNAKMKNNAKAFEYFQESLKQLTADNNQKDLAGGYISLSELYSETNQPDSAIAYGLRALSIAEQRNFTKEKYQSSLLLASMLEKSDSKTSLDYYKKAMNAKDSLYNQEKQRQVLSFRFNEEISQQEIKNLEQQSRSRNKLNLVLVIGSALLILSIFLLRNNKIKQRTNTVLQSQKLQIEGTLKDLRSAQAKLIQSEKMASLGELTAGIAHEIQNPLNFVNNFSDVNKELLVEMNAELVAGNSASAIEIARDLIDNEEKINHHGKRADAIVKGMLQHSRQRDGQRELCDINELTANYLALAYQGIKSKDPDLEVITKTDFDASIGKVNVVAQDIARVLLNLYNNAFYAVKQRQLENEPGYEATVSIATKQELNLVKLIVTDNGQGINQNIIDKIFQPFFTTKPAGEGTGLGLSLSYDIVKANGGELVATSLPGEMTRFEASFLVEPR